MSLDDAYSPPRHLAAKLRRRWVQARAARPAHLKLEHGALSICFDDFPRTAAESGARILERYGARGTFYAAAGLAERDGACGLNFNASDLTRLAQAGHEIGCHTYSHNDCAQQDAYDSLLDLARNRDALVALGYDGPLTALAYPYGETSMALKSSLPPRYQSARGVTAGLNRARIDLAHLRAFPLYGDDLSRAHAALKTAMRQRAWMIAYTHDVSDTPSPYGVTARALDQFVAAAREAGLTIAPVSAVLAKARI